MNHPPLPVAPAASRADARCVPGPAPAPAPPPEPADPLDAWLRRGLGRRFGAAAGEPVPEDLLRLVGEDRTGQELREVVAAFATVPGKGCGRAG